MNKAKKPEEKRIAIKKLRCANGYFTTADMVKVLKEHGITMSRQGYANKENGHSKFTVKEIQALAKIFDMDLDSTIRIFNDWD